MDDKSGNALVTIARNQGVILLPFVVVILLHIVGTLFPSGDTWGFNYWSVFDPLLAVPLLLVSAILIVPAVSAKATRVAERLPKAPLAIAERIRGPYPALLALALLFALLYTFRFRSFVYGDSLEVLVRSSESFGSLFAGQYQIHVMSVLLNRIAIHLLNGLGFSGETVLAVVSIIGGIVGFVAIYRLAQILKTDSQSGPFIFLAALSSASVILFFGFIEHYTWANSIGLWSLYFTIGSVKGRNGKLPAILLSLLAMSFHLITTPYLVTALLAVLYEKEKKSLPLSLSFTRANLLVVAGSFVAIAIVQSWRLSDMFVPLWPVSNNPYWFFSWAHVKDMLNESILVAPLGCVLLLFSFFVNRRSRVRADVVENILISLSLFTFLAAIWIDPHLGAARDWDLLSFYGIPLSLLGAYRWTRRFPEGRAVASIVLPAFLIVLIHVGPNVVKKSRPQLATPYLDDILWEDVHYQTGYHDASRGLSWAYMLYKDENMPERAIKYFRRRLEVLPRDFESWYHLGEIYFQEKNVDSADLFFSNALRCDPDNPKSLHKLGQIRLAQGNLEEALELVEKSARLDPDNASTQFALAVVLSLCNRLDEALAHFKNAYHHDRNLWIALINIGEIHASRGEYDSAYSYLTLARHRQPEIAGTYPLLINTQIKLGLLSEAAECLQKFGRLRPQAPELAELRKMISAGRAGSEEHRAE